MPEPESAAELYKQATETNLEAAAIAKRASATWNMVAVLAIGGTLLWAFSYDLRRRR